MAFRLALRLGCTAQELLARIDSRELAEWQAFERVQGPIDDVWRDTLLAEIHLQLQLANAYFVEVNSKDANLAMPQRVPLPWESWEENHPKLDDN
jgi:hypothetical protein